MTSGVATLTSATAGFLPTHVGNVVRVTGGANAGFYCITGFTSTSVVTVDRTFSNTLSGQSFKVGGASTWTSGGFVIVSASGVVSGNVVWVRGGTYSITVNSIDCSISATATAPIRLVGYSTTRGDNGRPTLNIGTSGISLLISGTFWVVQNFYCDGTGVSTQPLLISGNNNYVSNCRATRGASYNIGCSGFGNHIDSCESFSASGSASGISLTGAAGANRGSGLIERCTVHGNPSHGIELTHGNWQVTRNLIYGNTLDGIDYIASGKFGHWIQNNIISRNSRDGLRLASTDASGGLSGVHIQRNIFNRNGVYDVNYSPSDLSASVPAAVWAATHTDCNAFYTTGTDDIHQLPAFTNSTTLSSDPFTDSASADYSFDSGSVGGQQVLAATCSVTLPDGNVITQLAGPGGVPSISGSTLMRSLWREATGEFDADVVPDSVVDVYLDWGLHEWNRLVSYHQETSTSDIVLVAGTQEYTVPATWTEIKFVTHNGADLARGEIQKWRSDGDSWQRESAGIPTSYAFYANKIVFRPTPNAAAVAAAASPVVRAVTTPPSITTSGPEQLQSQDYRPVVLFASGLWSLNYPDSALAQSRAQGHMGLFEKSAEVAKSQYERRGISR